ncbi:hypothetical protein Ctob_010057, partial [Chrysochromulina tobinii]
MPAENETRASPMALPSRHVVILGGGEGLTREIALECVRRGADVTVLAAESDALTATYELMKTISLERPTQASEQRQQLRCSPLELSDGPMACFVGMQNVLEIVGRIDCFVCHPSELFLEVPATALKTPTTALQAPTTALQAPLQVQAVLCCVWAVRAIVFPMQRQAHGRVMVLGTAPPAASAVTRLSYKLAMQRLARSLRAELGEFAIPVSLASPL